MDLSSQDTLDEEFKRKVDGLTTYNVSVITTNKDGRDAKFKELEDFDVSKLTPEERAYFNSKLLENMSFRGSLNDSKNPYYKSFFESYNNLVNRKTTVVNIPATGGKSHHRKKSKTRSKSRSKSRGKSKRK
jgi:hypothetical protein